MYTEYIGKRVIERLQRRPELSSKSTRDLFDEVFYPLFFDDEERYLMHAGNSRFDQASKQRKKTPLTYERRQEVLADFHKDVNELPAKYGHLFLGGYTKKITDATASMVPGNDQQPDVESTYATWFGVAVAIGVKGGQNILVDSDAVLDRLIDGWGLYRKLLRQTPSLKGLQIQTWNAWWLIHSTDPLFDAAYPLVDFVSSTGALESKNGQAALVTAPWVKVLFALAQLCNPVGRIVPYVYNFGQLNTSIGFIPMELSDIRTLSDLYVRLFGDHDKENASEELKKLYQTEMGFIQACRHGTIGLQELRPAKIDAYIPHRRKDKTKQPKINKNEDHLTFNFYQTWLIAMIKDENILHKANALARVLTMYSVSERGKKVNQERVNKLLESKSYRAFVDAITEIVNNPTNATGEAVDTDALNELVDDLYKMPAANFPLFLTLVRFKYAFHNQKQSN